MLAVSLTLLYAALATAGGVYFAVAAPYYDLLAWGLWQGRLDLPVTPSPELLALPDPYDPAQNSAYRLHDASLYEGKYYLYWGPLPALPRLLWLQLAGALPLGLLWHLGAAVAAALGYVAVLHRVASLTHAPGQRLWLVSSAAALLFGPLMLYLVARPSIYHEPILWAMAALAWSWCALLRALDAPVPRARWV